MSNEHAWQNCKAFFSSYHTNPPPLCLPVPLSTLSRFNLWGIRLDDGFTSKKRKPNQPQFEKLISSKIHFVSHCIVLSASNLRKKVRGHQFSLIALCHTTEGQRDREQEKRKNVDVQYRNCLDATSRSIRPASLVELSFSKQKCFGYQNEPSACGAKGSREREWGESKSKRNLWVDACLSNDKTRSKYPRMRDWKRREKTSIENWN